MRDAEVASRVIWLDGAALVLSCLCMVHCLALPLLIALLPALSSILALPDSFHAAMVLIAVPASGVALVAGRARHRLGWPLMLGIAGLTLLAAAVLVPANAIIEAGVTTAGSVALIVAHAGNWSARRRSGACG